jgi:carbon monoxide dehydrogenase subunit G
MAQHGVRVIGFTDVLARASHFLLVALLSIAAIATANLAAHAQSGFSSGERRAIASGELVERPSGESRGARQYLGGASYRVIDRPAAEVWQALNDSGNFRHMLPNTSESAVVQRYDDGVVLRIGHHYGLIGASYHLRLRYHDDTRHLDFELDTSRSNDIAAARGFCEVSQYDGDVNRTLVTWAARVDPGAAIFLAPLRPEIQRWVLRVPSTMRTYLIDGSGRDRYRG